MSDKTKFEAMARAADDRGEHILAGIYRVEAGNDRSRHYKHHKPNVGPYGPTNPGPVCVDCGRKFDGPWLGKGWHEKGHPALTEECVPAEAGST